MEAFSCICVALPCLSAALFLDLFYSVEAYIYICADKQLASHRSHFWAVRVVPGARAWDGLGLGAAAARARRGGCLATCATYSLWNSSVKAKGGSEWRPGTASQPYSLIMMSLRKERLVRVKGEV